MKVAVTGASGFIGSHLVKFFRKNNIRVLGLSRKNGSYVDNVIENYNQVRDYQNLDVIIHLADLNLNQNQKNQDLFFNMEELSSFFQKKIIYISSALVYGNNFNALLNENCSPNPISSYAKNKFQNENIVLNNNGTVLRLSNVYGEGMSENNVFYDIFNQIIKKKYHIKIKNIKHIRDFVAVEDVCEAILKVVFKQKKGVYNISTGKGTSIEYLANLIIKYFGSSNIDYSLISENMNQSKLVLDPSYMNKIYSWKFKVNINIGCTKLLMKRKIK